ncbi:MAG: FAD-binding oxidoreductase [Candidatus Odinarchaeota archaeon]
MKNSLTKKELRELTLWGSEEPEELNPDFVQDLQKLFTGWNPVILDEEELSTEIEIPPPELPDAFLSQVIGLVGKENLKMGPKSRVLYSHGGSVEDLIRVRAGNFSLLCEAVVHPKSEDQVIKLLQICEKHGIAVVPVGGRTGVTRATHFTRKGIALDINPHLAKVLDINPDQQTAKVQAGITGPDLEQALQEKGYTLGHFPQSFEQCTVGGWVASRSAGQNSTLYGKIEDMVLSLRVATSRGILEQVITPACATGPQWFPYFIGSEGTLGVITEVTLRIHPDTSINRKFASYLFPTFRDGVKALKMICQSEFLPSIARLSDGTETYVYEIFSREGRKLSIKDKLIDKFLVYKKLHAKHRSILILVYEGSATYIKEVERSVKKASKQNRGFKAGSKYAKLWFKGRYEHPHLRDSLLDRGIITDTLETAGTWNNILKLQEAANNALKNESPIITAHCSHSYPEGSAIYFIYFTPAQKGKEVEQCRNMQKLALDAFVANGGVTSHHHGVGKAFIPWARKEWGERALSMATAVKKELDPKNILNPGNFPFDQM